MFSKTAIAALVVSLAVFGQASPIEKRAITVISDTGKASITPAIKTEPVSFLDGIGQGADLADAVIGIVDKVTVLIQGLIDKDIARRQRFTQETTSAVSVAVPGKNVVMSNVGYTLSCTPDSLTGAKYKAKVGSDVSYDVLTFGAGCTFNLAGDGGFENWAAITQSTCKVDGKTITC